MTETIVEVASEPCPYCKGAVTIRGNGLRLWAHCYSCHMEFPVERGNRKELSATDKLPPLPAPNPASQKRGKQNRAEGKAFEERLDASFAYYADRGYALIDKTPEPFKIIRRMEQTRFIGCFMKKAQPDYKGTVKGGRMVIFEAKYTVRDRIHQDAVSEAQWSYMELASDLGARCFVLVGFRSGRVYKVPWSLWRDMKEHLGRRYATENELQNYEVAGSWNDLLLVLD